MPCYFFPTKLLIIDDDSGLLRTIQLSIKDEYKSDCLSDLSLARNVILENKNWISIFLDTSFERSFDHLESEKPLIMIDTSNIKEKIYSKDRFNHVAVMIIDYDMPDMNGLEFVRSLGDHQLKIIMLTGKAGHDTVIKAFNDREINRYVSKGDMDYLEQISKYIEELNKEFFLDFSKSIIDSLKSETDIFSYPPDIEIFNQIIQDNGIVEYYLLDESGSYLMLDATAENQIWFIVKSEEEMRLLYELASEAPDTPTYVIKKLKLREGFTHFKNEQESRLDATYWNIIDCNPLGEDGQFYYTILKNDDWFKVDLSKVKSYQSFLDESESELKVDIDD